MDGKESTSRSPIESPPGTDSLLVLAAAASAGLADNGEGEPKAIVAPHTAAVQRSSASASLQPLTAEEHPDGDYMNESPIGPSNVGLKYTTECCGGLIDCSALPSDWGPLELPRTQAPA